jgi:hypothetical protein
MLAFRPPRAMLSERGEQSDDLSPKAKVTYDEDKFQVSQPWIQNERLYHHTAN